MVYTDWITYESNKKIVWTRDICHGHSKTVQDSFFKRRKNNTNLNTENYSYKLIKNIFQRKMLKQTKTQASPSSQNIQRTPHSMKHNEDLFPSLRVYTGYTLGIDFMWE